MRGEVRFAPYNRATEAIRPGLRVTLSLGAEPDRRLELSAARPHKNGFLLGLAGVDSMSEAERLVGARVLVDRADLPAAGEGEFYWLDLIGLQAVTEDGTPIGRVAGIFETPGHDVLVLRDGDRERLVPAVDEVVREVDVAGGRLVIRPVEGLLEL